MKELKRTCKLKALKNEPIEWQKIRINLVLDWAHEHTLFYVQSHTSRPVYRHQVFVFRFVCSSQEIINSLFTYTFIYSHRWISFIEIMSVTPFLSSSFVILLSCRNSNSANVTIYAFLLPFLVVLSPVYSSSPLQCFSFLFSIRPLQFICSHTHTLT